MSKLLALAVAAIVALSGATIAEASVMLVLTGGPGVNVNDIHVGDTFELDILAEGSSGEHYVNGGGGPITTSGNLGFLSAVFGTRSGDDFSTNPDLFDLTFKAIAAGAASVSTSGTNLTTNETSYTGLTSGPLNFTILAAVPEPAPWAMLIGGFGLIGAAMRRRRIGISFA